MRSSGQPVGRLEAETEAELAEGNPCNIHPRKRQPHLTYPPWNLHQVRHLIDQEVSQDIGVPELRICQQMPGKEASRCPVRRQADAR